MLLYVIPYVLSSFISFRTPIGNVTMYVLDQIMENWVVLARGFCSRP